MTISCDALGLAIVRSQGIFIMRDNILDFPGDAIVNPVNCVGVMGKGLALQFKNKYPNMFESYKALCRSGDICLGSISSYRLDTGQYIINFPTKHHWKDKSNIKDIEKGLLHLKEWAIINGIDSIAIPPLGCGLGGLDFNIVKNMIIDTFTRTRDLAVFIYEPR